jgi:hypothetical protein
MVSAGRSGPVPSTISLGLIELAPVSGRHASLLSGEEIVVRRVADASRRPGRGLRAAGLRRHAAHGVDPLYARALAERAFRADGLRGKQQPRMASATGASARSFTVPKILLPSVDSQCGPA